MRIRKINSIRPNEAGMAAFITVFILMTLLGLIAVGFSQLVNREVRRSLDNQQAAAAFYAAESGVNDAKAYLQAGGLAGPTTVSTGCAVPTGVSPSPFLTNGIGPSGVSGDILGNGTVRYNCVYINTAPENLEFSLQPGQSKLFILDATQVEEMFVSWQHDTSSGAAPTTLGNLGDLPTEESITTPVGIDKTGILRFALYPARSVAGDTGADLDQGSRNWFLYPDAGSGNLTCTQPPNGGQGCINANIYGTFSRYPTTPNGAFVSGNCNNSTHQGIPYTGAAPRFCNTEIDGVSGGGPAGYTVYYVRLTAYYSSAIGQLQIAGGIASGNQHDPTLGNQAIVDVTGTVNGVSQRLRSVIATRDEYQLPVPALWSMNTVCKLFRVPVDQPNTYGTPATDASAPSANGACAGSTPNNSGGPIP